MILVITGIIGLVLATYLHLVQSQNVFTVRSQTWNNCIPIIEAGVEEALAQLNKSANSNLAASGWSTTNGGFYKLRPIGDGYFRTTVTYANILFPTITVTGYLPAPPILASAGTGESLMAAAFTPDPSIKYIARTVRVTARKEQALQKGMIARNGIDLGGNQCVVDSYDSSKGGYDPAKAGDKGDVATNSDITGAVGIGNAKIKGKLLTGPKATAKIGPNGIVGSVAWHAAGNKGIQPGWRRNDMNIAIPDVLAPWSGGGVNPVGNGAFKYVLDTDNYELSSLNLAGDERIHIKGDAVLYVKANVKIAGEILFNPNSSLKLYCGGTEITLLGTYTKADVAAEFMVFGLPSVKTIEVSGIAAVLYAPNADLKLNGNAQFYGASVTKSVTMTGSTGFHYDEALSSLSQYKQYIITSWNEI